MESLKQNPNSDNLENWFDEIASQLLNRISFSIAKENHRLSEIEFYYQNELHSDPFTHCDQLQLTKEKWYFHRFGNTYRGGSFKGLDITFGDTNSFGGILIRSIEKENGEIIDGPCLCVNYILDKTGFAGVAELDRILEKRDIWDSSSPIFMELNSLSYLPFFTCARVGLSLKKAKKENYISENMTRYITRPYRYLNRPRKIRKGKIYLVLALYLQGKTSQEINQITGSPKKSIENYIREFEKGYQRGEFSDYFGVSLKNSQICQLHGIYKRSSQSVGES